jgi:hypothetical protein
MTTDITAHRFGLPAELAPYVEKMPVGVRIDPTIPPDLMGILETRAFHAHNDDKWTIADIIRVSEMVRGDTYMQYMDATQMSYSTLANYKYVASSFSDFSRRREKLSFSHHAEVAGLEPEVADAMLEAAERHGWGREELRQHVKDLKALPEPAKEKPEQPADEAPATPRVMTKAEYEAEAQAEQVKADDTRKPLPSKLLEIFGRKPELQAMLDKISEAKAFVEAIVEDHDELGAHWNVPQLKADLGNAYRQLKASLPYAVCPYCDSDGCKFCKTTGWVSKYLYDNFASEAVKRGA